jgi:UDP-N-acetylmuramoyl-tripeptide--D-alanyl-D-alanine ligase
MDAVYTAEEILELTQGRLASGLMPEDAGAICSDTRTLEEGEWFIALGGDQFDGHDFIGDAFAGGAIGCIVEERPSYSIANPNFPLIAVDSTYAAFYKLARNWRKRISTVSVLLCGDKKEVLDLIRTLERAIDERGKDVQSFYESGKEADALDFLLSIDANTDAVLFALFPDQFGAIERLARTVQPNVIVLLDGSLEHFRLSQSPEEILNAKRSLVSAMSRNTGTVIAVDLDPELCAELAESKNRDVRLFQSNYQAGNVMQALSSVSGEPGEFEPPQAMSSKAQLPAMPDRINWCLEQILLCLIRES